MEGTDNNSTPGAISLSEVAKLPKPPKPPKGFIIWPIILVALLIILKILVSFVFFYVDVTEQAVKTEFGKVVGVYAKPGPHMKLPWQSVSKLPANIVEFDAPPANVMTRDGKMIIVDNFAVWRIQDPVLFIKSAKSVAGAQTLLDDIVYSDLRSRMGQLKFVEIISTGRDRIMRDALAMAQKKMTKYGVSIINRGLRTKRTDLPDENMQAVYERMIADRKKIADRYRAEGKEQATIIKSEADREAAELQAKAVEESQTIKGNADANATRIYSAAYNRDPEFYDFLRHTEVLGDKLKGTLFLPKDSKILRYLH